VIFFPTFFHFALTLCISVCCERCTLSARARARNLVLTRPITGGSPGNRFPLAPYSLLCFAFSCFFCAVPLLVVSGHCFDELRGSPACGTNPQVFNGWTFPRKIVLPFFPRCPFYFLQLVAAPPRHTRLPAKDIAGAYRSRVFVRLFLFRISPSSFSPFKLTQRFCCWRFRSCTGSTCV